MFACKEGQVYEDNFQLLKKLLPELQVPQCCLAGAVGKVRGLTVDIIEHHKYTTVIRLTQNLSMFLPVDICPVMTVRVYHDAQVAEVLSYQNYRHFQPRYDYPNRDMCQRREKLRVNEFLAEWLWFCLIDTHCVEGVAKNSPHLRR